MTGAGHPDEHKGRRVVAVRTLGEWRGWLIAEGGESDATRRDIVVSTLGGEHSVSALADGYSMSFAAVQKHVAVLERADLVLKRRRGREQLVSGNVETIRRAGQLLDQLELRRPRADPGSDRDLLHDRA